MDPLVLGLVVFSAACFLAFALGPRSTPRSQIEVMRQADDGAPTPVFGKAAAPAP